MYWIYRWIFPLVYFCVDYTKFHRLTAIRRTIHAIPCGTIRIMPMHHLGSLRFPERAHERIIPNTLNDVSWRFHTSSRFSVFLRIYLKASHSTSLFWFSWWFQRVGWKTLVGTCDQFKCLCLKSGLLNYGWLTTIYGWFLDVYMGIYIPYAATVR